MIRRSATVPELNMDSLTDTMTNTVGLILLMVVVSSIITRGIKISLPEQLRDPAGKTPLYLVCKDRHVFFMQKDDEWLRELKEVCSQLQSQLGRKPTTSEALVEANQSVPSLSPDLKSTFVREIARERGRQVYIIGVRFLVNETPQPSEPDDTIDGKEVTFSAAARSALDEAQPDRDYLDVFVYENDLDALLAVQETAKARGFRVGWRVVLEQENPGLSELGISGKVTGGEP